MNADEPQHQPAAGPEAPRPFKHWMLAGLVPAMVHGLVLLAADTVMMGDDAVVLLLALPIYAFVYLVGLALATGEIRTYEGRRIHKALYVVGMLILNLALWVGGCALAFS